MAMTGQRSRYPASWRSLLWSCRDDSAMLDPRNWGQSLTVARHDGPLDYSVMTGDSAFPAGWVRFDASHQGYVFTTVLPGHQGDGRVHANPERAVPAWVGAHTLKKIHPIPEHVTGDMIAAAPAMLELLKQVRALMDEHDEPLPGLDPDDIDHVVAVAEGRG